MSTGAQTAKDSTAQSTTDAPNPPSPLIAPTGDGTWDTLAADINQAAAPFQNLSSSDASGLDKANDVVSGLMGAIMTPLNLLNDGFALLTAPIAKLFPPLPAATLGMLHLGIPHEHDHPPAFPIPLPSFGPVALAGSASVLINGIPAARAGDIGIAITCGTFAPPFEVFTGSSKVFIGGARAARMLDITRHCQPGGGWSALAKLAEVGMGLLGLGTEVLGAVTQASDAKKDRDKAAKEADKAKTAADRAQAAKAKVDAAKAALQKAASAPSGDGGGSSGGGGSPDDVAAFDAQADALDAQMDADDAKAQAEADAQAQAIADAEDALEEAEEEEDDAEEDEAEAEEEEQEYDAEADGADASAKTSAIQAGLDAAAMALGLLMGLDPGLTPCFGMLLSGMPNVLIGGFPMPPWGEVAHGLKKLPKLKNKLKKLKNPFKCDREGHPIDPVTGANVGECIDYEDAEGASPFRWGRSYTSLGAGRAGPMGRGFRHTYEHDLQVDLDRALYTDPEWREVEIPLPGSGTRESTHAGHTLRIRDEGNDVVYTLSRRGAPALEFVRERRAGAEPRLVRVLEPEKVREMRYDDRGRLSGMIEASPAGPIETRLTLDPWGRITELCRGPSGARDLPILATYAYDHAGCLTVWQDALGARETYAYDAGGRLVRLTYRNGYSFHYAYDPEGRCTEEHGDDGLFQVALRYEPEERRTVATRAGGGEWVYGYDEEGTITSIRDPYGGERSRIVDDEGKVVREVDTRGRVLVSFLHDERGTAEGVVDRFDQWHPSLDDMPEPTPDEPAPPSTALDQQWGRALDALPEAEGWARLLPAEVQAAAASLHDEPRGPGRETRRDALGRVVEETDGEGRRSTWAYDPSGNEVRHVDRDGREHRREMSSWNLLGAQIDPLGNTTRYDYTPRREIARVVDAGGSESRYEYDQKDRLVRVFRHGVLREEYVYDPDDRLVEKRDGSGQVLVRHVNGNAGLPTVRRLASGETYRYTYDERGRTTRASGPGGEVRRAFDERGQLIVDERNGLGVRHRFEDGKLRETTYLGRFTVTYRQTPDGSLEIEAPVGGVQRIRHGERNGVLAELGNGTSVLSFYDGEDRCQERLAFRARGGQIALWSACWAYSAEGELRRVDDRDRGTTSYAYDAAHRLVGVSGPAGASGSIVLDAAGNVLEKPGLPRVELAEGNRLRAAGRERFGYDARNHLAEHDAGDGAPARYRYDSLDMLTGISWGGDHEAWSAAYDGLARRIHKTHGARRTEFYWDGDRLAAEVGPTGTLRIYVYPGPEALVPLMFVDYPAVDAAPGSGLARYPIGDQIGVPLHVEDQAGAVVWRASHVDPYGAVTVHPGATITYARRFPGHYLDEETGLHENRYRYYSPRLGRYLQSDPAGQSGGTNLYAYAESPMVDVDVLGLFSCKAFFKRAWERMRGIEAPTFGERRSVVRPPNQKRVQKVIADRLAHPDRNVEICWEGVAEIMRQAGGTHPGRIRNKDFAHVISLDDHAITGPADLANVPAGAFVGFFDSQNRDRGDDGYLTHAMMGDGNGHLVGINNGCIALSPLWASTDLVGVGNWVNGQLHVGGRILTVRWRWPPRPLPPAT